MSKISSIVTCKEKRLRVGSHRGWMERVKDVLQFISDEGSSYSSYIIRHCHIGYYESRMVMDFLVEAKVVEFEVMPYGKKENHRRYRLTSHGITVLVYLNMVDMRNDNQQEKSF